MTNLPASQRADLERRRLEHETVLVALKRLLAEVRACLGTAEVEMREALGNTNVNCLRLRADEAAAVIAKAESC